MSGGSLGYFYNDLESHIGDFGDAELDDLVKDLAQLFHDREWFLSADTCEGTWNEARDAFKAKWFTQTGRQERIEQYLDELREKVLKTFGLSKKYCMNCQSFTPKKGDLPYGCCEYEKNCLMHRAESCDRFSPRVGERMEGSKE